MRGLNPSFKMQLRMLKATEFQELVDAAITMEDDFKQVQEEKRKKAKFETKKFVSNKPNTNLTFKPRYNPSGNKRASGSQFMANIICRRCGSKGHYSKDCRRPKVICFGRRQEGHMLKDFPSRNNGGGKSGGGGSRNGNSGGNWKNKKPFGKLNCTSLEEVINSDKAVIGTLQILTHPGKVLFDTGATTSFISRQFIIKHGINCTKLETPITILSAGGTILVTHVKQEQVIMIHRCVFYVDLFVLPMKDIAVILGMN